MWEPEPSAQDNAADDDEFDVVTDHEHASSTIGFIAGETTAFLVVPQSLKLRHE